VASCAQRSRYRRLVGLVTSVVGNGKRVRVQFTGLSGTALLQASTLEIVDVAHKEAKPAAQQEAQQEAQAAQSPGGQSGARQADGVWRRGGGSLAAVSWGSARDSLWGARGAEAPGCTLHRWLTQREMAPFSRGVPWGALRGRRPLRAMGSPSAVAEGGSEDPESGDDAQQTGGDAPGEAEGGGVVARRSGGLVKGAGGGKAARLPLGYSFKGPAPGSDQNPCVQGDMQPWVQELYGVTGRRYKGGP